MKSLLIEYGRALRSSALSFFSVHGKRNPILTDLDPVFLVSDLDQVLDLHERGIDGSSVDAVRVDHAAS